MPQWTPPQRNQSHATSPSVSNNVRTGINRPLRVNPYSSMWTADIGLNLLGHEEQAASKAFLTQTSHSPRALPLAFTHTPYLMC